MDWKQYKKQIKSLSVNEIKAIEILALLGIDYSDEIIKELVKILEKQ